MLHALQVAVSALVWLYIAVVATVFGFVILVSTIAYRSLRRAVRRQKHPWV